MVGGERGLWCVGLFSVSHRTDSISTKHAHTHPWPHTTSVVSVTAHILSDLRTSFISRTLYKMSGNVWSTVVVSDAVNRHQSGSLPSTVKATNGRGFLLISEFVLLCWLIESCFLSHCLCCILHQWQLSKKMIFRCQMIDTDPTYLLKESLFWFLPTLLFRTSYCESAAKGTRDWSESTHSKLGLFAGWPSQFLCLCYGLQNPSVKQWNCIMGSM